MLPYRSGLRSLARRLRREMTDAETKLWERLRRKQLAGVQFYRQKPLGDFIVDFHAPAAKLVIEVDGSQHLEQDQRRADDARDEWLRSMGLLVLRYDNAQVLLELDAVVSHINEVVEQRLSS